MLVKIWGKENTYPLLVGGKTCTVTMEISGCFLRKLGIELPQDPAKLVLVIYPKASTASTASTAFTAFSRDT